MGRPFALLSMSAAIAFAVSLRRGDILKNLPAFLFIRTINCVVFLHTFWLEIVRNRKQTQWFSVARYQQPQLNTDILGGMNA